jgi:putative spermidine/putrescine transport system permease protein
MRNELRRGLHRARRQQIIQALGLMAPLLIFLLVNFAAPIAVMLARSVRDPELPTYLPQTAIALRHWDAQILPDEALVRGFVTELASAKAADTLPLVANRLNYDQNGFRGLILKTARHLPLAEPPPLLEQLLQIDPRWGDLGTWAVLKHAAGPVTSFYLLAALDRRLDVTGSVVETAPEQRIFIDIFARTFWISLVVTIACLALGYPLAYLLASLPQRLGNLLMILVLLPFWTSVLVRTTAWIVVLQRDGMANGLLRWLGLIREPLDLVYNRTGVYIAMTHVLLPFMVLPLYGVMKGISPIGMRAALSLGARPLAAFRRVYLPQSLPGVSAGSLLVFILALGYFITPALLGGANDQMIAYFIAFYTNQTLNWGMAAALSVTLLTSTIVLYGVYTRLVGSRGLKWQ